MDVRATQFGSRVQSYFDLIVLACAVVFGIVVTAMSAALGIGQYGMGGGALLASGVYIVFRRRGLVTLRSGSLPQFEIYSYKLASIVFFALLAGATFANWSAYQYRSPFYFALIAFAFSTLFVDVFAIRQEGRLAYVTLAKIVLVSLLYRASRFYELATIPGNDTQYHLNFALIIADSGHLPAVGEVTHIRYIYTAAWHVGTAIAHNVFGTSLRNLLFFGSAVPFAIITSLGCYALARSVFGGVEYGLLAALFVSVADFFVLRGASAIYTSSYVIPLTVIALLALYQVRDKRAYYLVTIALGVAILTHQLSSFAMLAIIVVLIGAVELHRWGVGGQQSSISQVASRSLVLTAGFGVIAHWMVTETEGGRSFFDSMFLRLTGTIVGLFETSGGEGGGGYGDSLAQYSDLSNLLYNFGSDLLFTLAVLGILLVAYRANQSPKQLYLFAPTLVMFMLIYPLTQFGLDHLILPHRILAFFQLFLVLFAALAVGHVLRQTSNLIGYAVIGVVIFVLVFSMITAPYITRNSPVYLEDREPRVDLYDSEAMAAEWVLAHSEGDVYHDPHMHNRQFMSLANLYGYEYSKLTLQEYPADETPTEGTFIVRTYFEELEDVAPRGTFGFEAQRVDGGEVTDQYRTGSKGYDNGKTEIYIA